MNCQWEIFHKNGDWNSEVERSCQEVSYLLPIQYIIEASSPSPAIQSSYTSQVICALTYSETCILQTCILQKNAIYKEFLLSTAIFSLYKVPQFYKNLSFTKSQNAREFFCKWQVFVKYRLGFAGFLPWTRISLFSEFYG